MGALFAAACAGSEATNAPRTAADGRSNDAQPVCAVERPIAEARLLVDKYCVSCHSPNGAAGEEHDFRTDAAITARRRNIEAELRLHAMPPPAAPQPSEAERTVLRCWAEH